MFLYLTWINIHARRGDVEFIQVRSTKGATGDATRGDIHDAIYLSVSRKTNHAGCFPSRIPNIALGVHGGTIWVAVSRKFGEDSFVADVS